MLIDIKEVVLPTTNVKIWVLVLRFIIKYLNKIIRLYSIFRKLVVNFAHGWGI